ncbi:MAG: LysM peptidoglycan-binding domain-containing protein [SAR324 cluster bacterium]|nr:LysM peptidoglycan-binding domain-containing protein [SAR324 cluster bacterium]MBL7035620.1 LysM peptidoglycan-binding domain-containing protein [SAR324 cluster bacterium]
MREKVLNINGLFALFFLLTFAGELSAASPQFQPAPLRNQALMFETSGRSIENISLATYKKSKSKVKQQILTKKETTAVTKPVFEKTPYRNRFWQVEGQSYDIPIRYNSKIKRVIRRLVSKKRKQMIRGIKRSGRYIPMITEMLRKEGMPLDLAYVVPAESNFNVSARSHKSAVGLWQFIASTGRIYGLKINRWVDERRDPVLSTKAAITYLKHLYGLFGNWELAIAAYNTGEGRVKRAIKVAKRQGKKTDFWSLRLPRETRGYVPAIMAMAVIYKNPERYGLGHVRPDAAMDETKSSLSVAFSLEEVAKRSKISFKTLREMNTALFLGVPPMTQARYSFYVPQENKKLLIASLEKNPQPSKKWGLSYNALLGNSARVTTLLEKFGAPIYFRVRNGDNLWDLARKHKTSIRRLARWNRLNSKSVLHVNRRMKTYVPTWKVFKEVARKYSSSGPSLIAQRIRVPKGGALSKIAEKYRTSVRKLMRWNKLSSPHAIRAGQSLVVGYRRISNTRQPRSISVIQVPRNTTLSHLALRYKTTVKKLMSWNGMNNSKQLRTGMRLFVKAPPKGRVKLQKKVLAKRSSSRAPQVRHRIIRVRNGDTLWRIARTYRTTVKVLISLNELTSANHLRLNQKLIVPSRS